MKKVIFGAMALCLFFASDVDAKTYHSKKYNQEFQLGLKRDKKKHTEFKKHAKKKSFLEDVIIPGKYDLTLKVSPPENQGSCGSCWDFGITKAFRSAYMLVGNDTGTLAFNYLLDNCGSGPAQYGCNGGDFDAGQSFLKDAPWLESQDPYTQRQGRCANISPRAAKPALAYNVVGSGNTAPSFKDLSGAVSQDHMLVVDVAVCGSWGDYSGGIFSKNQCGASSINHIINLVGYDCETSIDATGNCVFDAHGQPVKGDGFLIVMNNWGTSWGENGYMRTRWGVDAIADTAMYFEVEKPIPPTPPVPPVPPTPPTPPSSFPFWGWILIGLGAGVGLVLIIRR